MNESEARAERKRLGYSTLVEREMLDPDFRARVEAEEAVIAWEIEARDFARLVAQEMIVLQTPVASKGLGIEEDDVEKQLNDVGNKGRHKPLWTQVTLFFRRQRDRRSGAKTKR